MFIGEVALNLNWAIIADMLLVRDSNRRDASGMLSVLLFSCFKTDCIQGLPIEVDFLFRVVPVALFFYYIYGFYWFGYSILLHAKHSMVCNGIIINIIYLLLFI